MFNQNQIKIMIFLWNTFRLVNYQIQRKNYHSMVDNILDSQKKDLIIQKKKDYLKLKGFTNYQRIFVHISLRFKFLKNY